MQNDKKKFVDLKYEKNKNNFLIHGSSYKGSASLNNVIGNWWNHKILESDSQISPLSGSIKKQTVQEFYMKFKPLHDRVLIEVLDSSEKTAGGIIIPDTAQSFK